MITAMRKLMAPVQRGLALMIGRGLVKLIDDSGGLPRLQITLVDGELTDGVEWMQSYGLASHPHPGAEQVFAAVGGLRAAGVVIAVADRRYRLKVAEGETALYDDLGQTVWLKRDGIHITTTLTATVTAAHCNLISNDVNLGATGGKKVALDGDPVVAGQVQASSTKVKAL